MQEATLLKKRQRKCCLYTSVSTSISSKDAGKRMISVLSAVAEIEEEIDGVEKQSDTGSTQ